MKTCSRWIGLCWLGLVAGALPAHAASNLPVSAASFVALRSAYSCAIGDPCYDASVDYDADGRIGSRDLITFKLRVQLAARGGDATPPTVLITHPRMNQTLRGTITITVLARDDFGVRGVATFVEGMDPYPSVIPLASYQLSLDTRTIPNGDQVVRANAVDHAGNLRSSRVAVRIDNPPSPAADGGPGVVIVDDLDGDGRHTGEDLKIGLALCAPGCTLRALARTYEDVELTIPAGITGPLIIEGAGMGQTVFRSPVPWTRSVITVTYPNPLVTLRDLSIDGRKQEQISSLVAIQAPSGIRVANPWGADSGPGIIERVEIKNMLNAGIGISGGSGWIVRHSKIHDNGCSSRFPCPQLRLLDPGARLHDPTWQSVGYGIVVESSNTTAHDNEIWNINKIGIEAFDSWLVPYAQLMSGFHFHHNYVHDAGGGIGSNGGRGGWIESNTVTFSSGHGVFCGGQTGDLVFNDNLISHSGFAGLWVTCWGPNITVANNRIVNNCRADPGGSSGLLVDAGTQFGGGVGLAVQDNFVAEPLCRSASEISFRRDVRISGNEFRGGRSLGTLILHDAANIVVSDGWIDAENRVPAGIFLLGNLDGLRVRSNVTMTGHTQMKVITSDPATVTNIVIE